MTDNVPATQEEKSPAQKQRDRIDQFMGFLEDPSRNLPQLLADSGIKPPQFLAVARRAISNNPDLLNCTPASLLKAFINCATDGLLPDGRQAAIVIYKNRKQNSKEAQYQSMYQGLLDVAYRSGNFTSIQARVVYEGDHFDYALGDNEFIDHKPRARPAGHTAKIVNAYAIAKTTNGGVFREVFEADDIRKVMALARSTDGPGKDWPEEMARKGPLRRMWKFLPKNDQMARIAEHRDAVPDDLIDLTAADVTEPQRRTIRTGFAPRAIEQSVQPTVDIPIDTREPELVHDQDQVDEQQQNSAEEPIPPVGAPAEGEGTEAAPPADNSPPSPVLPDGYDIIAWANTVPEQLAALDTAAKFDEWTSDPETAVRLDRLHEADPKRHETLAAAAKARRLKLSRAK